MNRVAIEDMTETDIYRSRLTGDDRLTLMHTRIYDHWLPIVGAPTAYRLALTGWSDDCEYQRLKQEAGQI